jgi:hypothetical protein
MPASIGHNQGPPLDELGIGWSGYCWRRAHRRGGMSYREYTAILLDRGIHL